ncbi:uncharacterized protein isoform X5 [Danio rerio]
MKNIQQILQRNPAQGALCFSSSRPAGLMQIRAGLGFRARPQFRPDEDALLQAIRSLHHRPEGGASTHQTHRFTSSRKKITQSGSTLPRAHSNPQRFTINTSGSTRLFNTSSSTLTRPAQASTERQQSCSEASEEAPTHTSASASKIFFSDQDEIPGLGDEEEALTPIQTIRRRAQEMEERLFDASTEHLICTDQTSAHVHLRRTPEYDVQNKGYANVDQK